MGVLLYLVHNVTEQSVYNASSCTRVLTDVKKVT
jgi:hypothetical protein